MVSTSPTGLFLISRCDSSTSEISKIPKVGKRVTLLGRETLNTSRPIPLANQRKSTKCSFFVSALHKLGSPRFPGFPDGSSIGVFYFVKKSCNFQKKRFWFVIYLQYIEYSPRKKRNRFIEATTSFQGPKRGLGNPRGTLILFLGNPGNLFVVFFATKKHVFSF